jgi:hypothetical protein
MLTQDQLNTIGGESVFVFETCIGISGMTVIVRMSYEYDASGIYNETVDNVLTSGKTSIMDYLEEETIDQLCMRGCMLLNEKEVY